MVMKFGLMDAVLMLFYQQKTLENFSTFIVKILSRLMVMR